MMPKSLLYKLLGAFLLVTLIGSIVIMTLTSVATRNAFSIYTTRNGQVWAQTLAPQLAQYYEADSSWQGVDVFIQNIQTSSQMTGSAVQGIGSGHGSGFGNGTGMGRQMAGYGFMGGSGQRIILTYLDNRVLVDTAGELKSQQLSDTQMKYGVDILSGDKIIGKVLVTPLEIAGSGTPAGEFLADVNWAILSSALIAAILALVLGWVLFRQIIFPLRKLQSAAVSIENGDLSGRVDIHSRDEFQDVGQAFNQMADSLARVENQRRQMMADVAHELRTPLTAIQGTVEAMQDGLLPSDSEQLEAIYNQTTVLNRLINDLRLISLAEAGQLKLEKRVTDLNLLLQIATDGLKPLALQKSIQILLDVNDDLPKIIIDPDRINQVVTNLLSNSIRYTPKNGNICVTGKLDQTKTNISISVTDDGIGIDAENLPKIFDRFFRTDKSRNRISGGSGLGLSIVKYIIEAHGGSVNAESPIYSQDGNGYGTRVIFSIPF
jgi:signal transduction histidine kinase